MLNFIASRSYGVRRMRTLLSHSCRSFSTASSPVQDESAMKTTTQPLSNDEMDAEHYLDHREKFPGVKPAKVLLTDKLIEQKLIYNSLAHSFTDRSPFIKRVSKQRLLVAKERKRERAEMMEKEVDSIVALKLMGSKQVEGNEIENQEEVDVDKETEVDFPYRAQTPVSRKLEEFKAHLKGKIAELPDDIPYGTEDDSIPASNVPCGGCGAHLQCRSASVPGYLPSEIFTAYDTHGLRGQICQRCRFLREHNVALNVQISPEDYPKVISAIRDEVALVILVVDLLDFPCSIWPGLLDIIGEKRPVVVVGNKIDLIPKDRRGYLERIKKSLVDELDKSGLSRANIKHVSLISATTGYGVEQLITKIQSSWGYRGDVYVLGCTNVGKSSLFNALINSDFCKTQAIDLVQRATVSPWPGTTLNLLKFPMLRPSAIRLHERVKRLVAEREFHAMEEKIRREQLKETGDRVKYATLIGHIGRTFEVRKKDDMESADPFHHRTNRIPGESANIFNPEHKDFLEGKWCYDTPGTVNPEQILTLLTLEELMTALPKRLIKPRTLLVRPGTTYFLGGLGRIDYLDGPHSLMLTTFAASRLPLSLIPIQDADEMYSELLGSPVLAVPTGGPQRLAQWPGLTGKEVSFKGVGWKESAIDVVLSSAGWVALTGELDMEYKLKVYTPEGKGIHVRTPPLLPHAVMLRGSRLERSPAFQNNRLCLD